MFFRRLFPTFRGDGVNTSRQLGFRPVVQPARPPLLIVLLAGMLVPGCGAPFQHLRRHHAEPLAGASVSNPLLIRVSDHELVWGQVSDAVAMFFRIQREERVRVLDDLVLEGRIETHPEVGSTLFEPWRQDSTPGYERWHATLQSIRRRAVVRVIPSAGGFLIDVAVHKELEDVNQPEHATVSRSDSWPERRPISSEDEGPPGIGQTVGWIPLGRDELLEQRILHDIQARLST